MILGYSATTRVVVSSKGGSKAVRQLGNRDLVLIIKCACADGIMLKPLLIWKAT